MLMDVMTNRMATIGTTTVSTVRAPNRTSCCGSTSASGRRATRADRSSGSTSLCARISSRVRRGSEIVWSSGPMAPMSWSGSTSAADPTARAAPTRRASRATSWVTSMRRASSEDATSPSSQLRDPHDRAADDVVDEDHVAGQRAVRDPGLVREVQLGPDLGEQLVGELPRAPARPSGTACPGRSWTSSIESSDSAMLSSLGVRTPGGAGGVGQERGAFGSPGAARRPSDPRCPRIRSDRHSRVSMPTTCRSPSMTTRSSSSPASVVRA